ncbi:serine/threonine protein kinase-36 [Apiospora kogelbergensis]|uniref:serine/threonine protein kinase-36 n=1 Tax=Apiospora kogelbergensis TaxID=1337665 RepID=UPI00313074E7
MTFYHHTEAVVTQEAFASLTEPRYREFDVLDFDPNFEVDDELEDLEGYQPGGFCPIDISFPDFPSIIHDRFQIIYKLGFGGFGTVWLCYDLVNKTWRALKVHQAGKSLPNQLPEASRDMLVSRTMERHSVSVEEALDNGIAIPLETFWIDSPNGRHLYKMPNDPGRIKHISHQIVRGMDFLHRQGLCHGDFRPTNVLLKLKEGVFDDMSVDDMRELLGPPTVADVKLKSGGRSPHAPELVFACVEWKYLWKYVSDDIAITDFGESYETNNPNPPDLGIPEQYAAPEIVIGGDKSMATDIWALGCTLWDLRCRHLPYTWPIFMELVRTMEDWMGPCPQPFRLQALQKLYEEDIERWKQKGGEENKTITKPEPPNNAEALTMQTSTYITETDKLHAASGRPGRGRSIEDHLGREHLGVTVDGKSTRFSLSVEEIRCFGDLLHKIFQWQPRQRWDTARIMGHEWFVSPNESPEKPGSAPDQDPIMDDGLPVDTKLPSDVVDVSQPPRDQDDEPGSTEHQVPIMNDGLPADAESPSHDVDASQAIHDHQDSIIIMRDATPHRLSTLPRVLHALTGLTGQASLAE